MAGQESFLLLLDDLEDLDKLTDHEAGQLFRAIVMYQKTGLMPEELAVRADCMFGYIRRRLDKNREKYEETCRKRAEAGSKGGKQKAANAMKDIPVVANVAIASKSKQSLANLADNDNDSDIDNDIDNENENEGKEAVLPAAIPAAQDPSDVIDYDRYGFCGTRRKRIRYLEQMLRMHKTRVAVLDKSSVVEYTEELLRLRKEEEADGC